MSVKRFLVAGAAIVLSGCIQTRTAMLDDRTEAISGLGGTVVSMAEVQQKVLVTAATDAQARGFRYFVVLSAADSSRSGAIFFPGQTYTSGTATAQATRVGNTAYGNANYQQSSYTTPGFAAGTIQPGQDIVVRFYKEGEIDPHAQGVWDAQSVLAAQPKK